MTARTLTVSRDATPDYAPQYTLYEEDGGQGKRIATVFSEKDAHLFANARDLLALVREVLTEGDTTGGNKRSVSRYTIDKARALLATLEP